MTLRRLAAAAALAWLSLSSAPARADYLDDYRAGLEAFERGDLDRAIAAFQAAIAQRPQEAGLLSGPLLRRYNPHFHLGLALARAGRCRAAIVALDESERQGKVRELDELRRERDRCRERVNAAETSAGQARGRIDEAASTAAAVALLESSPVLGPVWNEGSPSFADRQSTALERLARARTALDKGLEELDDSAIAEAGELASRAAGELAGLRDEAEVRRDRLREAWEAQLAKVRETATLARRELRFVESSFDGIPGGAAAAARALEADLHEAGDSGTGAAIEDLAALEARIRRDLAALRRAVKAPPAELFEAVESYLGGDYARALERVGQVAGSDPRVRAHACLVRAAATFALARLPDPPFGEVEVRAAIRDCLGADAPIAPGPDFFPPPFVELYEAERAAAAVATPD